MKMITVLLFSWFAVLPALADNTAKEYKITKEWKADPNSPFELIARNQNFRVVFWDKDIVRIDFVLESNTTKIDEEEFKNGLKVSAEKSGNKLTVSTSLGDLNTSSVWNWIFNDKKGKGDYRQNNVIYLPRNSSSLSFMLNYCELKINDMNHPLKITSNYGTISIGRNRERSVINATYSDITLGEMSHVKISSSYDDLLLDKIDTLIISSNYGDIKLSSCSQLQALNINYGDVAIEHVGYLKTTGTYSDIKISHVMQEVNAVLTYSDITLSDLSKYLSGVTITGTYSDTKIKINPEQAVQLFIHEVNGDIALNNTQLILLKRNETSNVTTLTAKTRTATDASPVIKINGKNSDVTIN